MTVKEIQASEKDFLTPAEVAEVYGSDPQFIRMAAREGTLGVACSLIGCHVRIPRVAFLRFLGYDPA